MLLDDGLLAIEGEAIEWPRDGKVFISCPPFAWKTPAGGLGAKSCARTLALGSLGRHTGLLKMRARPLTGQGLEM